MYKVEVYNLYIKSLFYKDIYKKKIEKHLSLGSLWRVWGIRSFTNDQLDCL